MQEECKSTKCAAATAAFARCEEKINDGKGYHGETCVEELYVISNMGVELRADYTLY